MTRTFWVVRSSTSRSAPASLSSGDSLATIEEIKPDCMTNESLSSLYGSVAFIQKRGSSARVGEARERYADLPQPFGPDIKVVEPGFREDRDAWIEAVWSRPFDVEPIFCIFIICQKNKK